MFQRKSALNLILITGLILFTVSILPQRAWSFSLFPPKKTAPAPTVVLKTPADKYAHQAQEFDQEIKKIARTLFANLAEPDAVVGDLGDGVVMSSFVDLKKLSRTSSFGRYIAERMMTEFQHQGYNVVEIRKTRDILIQPKRGEYGLSRDIKQIAPRVTARAMVTGTYTVAGDKIMVNARIIDNKNAALLSSASGMFNKDALTTMLLSDAVSAAPRPNGVIYMKRLDL